ncbi:MAG TPA: MFS transporter [Candidatus Micrarchaeia archaeon]|nr:MFS transporter [Candidatus Micrarchaeia archaeon]
MPAQGQRRSRPPRPPGYGAVLRLAQFRPLYAATVLARTASQMQTVVAVLFALRQFHSPELAGLTVLAQLPGIVLSPVTGALLDRHHRIRLIALDYGIAGGSLAWIGGLALGGALRPWSLLAIFTLAGLTSPLSWAGTKTLFPTVVPKRLWDRANALDSAAYVVATILGPGVAGVLVALLGESPALIANAAVYALAIAAVAMVRVPAAAPVRRGGLLRDAGLGLRYVLHHPTLRGLALGMSLTAAGWGILTIGLPVLVLHRLHSGPAAVGWLWGLSGAMGLVVGLAVGRLGTDGRERMVLNWSIVVVAVGTLIVALAGSLVVAAAGMLVIGAGGGPFDVALFSLRQRRTERVWFGRAFAISMSLNYVGTPIGAALGGLLVAASAPLALVVAAGITLAAWPVVQGLVPAESIHPAPQPSAG